MHPDPVDSVSRAQLCETVVRLVRSDEQPRYQQLMREHHYLGYLPKIGETLWYVASWREQWLALLSFSGSALKCAPRDHWIGWSLRQHYGRLKLVVNNSRFLILPDGHVFNLGSRVLSLCERRLPGDWDKAFRHSVVLLETFVDPQRHRGTVYRAANWVNIGNTRGYRRTHAGYTNTPQTPKMVFVKPLRADARQVLCSPILSPPYRFGGTTMRMTAEQMRSLPSFFAQIPDPRRAQGTRHRLSTVLGIAAGAVLCGMRGYQAIAEWAQSLGQQSRRRFSCRYEGNHYVVPSEYVLRDVLIRVTPAGLDRALQRWKTLDISSRDAKVNTVSAQKETNLDFSKPSRPRAWIGANPLFSSTPQPITDASKRARSGRQKSGTRISIFRMWGNRSSSSGTAR